MAEHRISTRIVYALRLLFLMIIFAVLPKEALSQSFDTAVEAYKRKDFVTALGLFESLANTGNVRAQANVAHMYLEGEGTSPDLAKARLWYQRAADQGFAPSQYDLGVMYLEGEGVPPNLQTAISWLTKAADQGFLPAQQNLAELAFFAKDFKQALLWYEKAADQGDGHAAFNVGSIYYKGLGVPKDTARAIEFYRKAARLGQPDAAGALRQLGVNP
jgi:TPR repeat protein